MMGFIYFIQNGTGEVKIGYTENVRRRLHNLQIASPTTLNVIGQMPGTVSEEREIHHRFAHARLVGEWFRPDPDMIALAKQYPPPDVPRHRKMTIRASQIPEIAELLNELVRCYANTTAFAAALGEILNDVPVSPQGVSQWKTRGIAPAWRYPVWYLASQNGIELDLHEFMTGSLPTYEKRAAA
jgi:hypothetical protein